MTKVFIDGSVGTTGLRIKERLSGRKDITILSIDDNERKNIEIRKEFINNSDITFLCLPDDAAIQAVSLVDNPNVKIIDASTAHRTSPDWVYGLPELSSVQRAKITTGKRVAVPGCHAGGLISLVYPLITKGILPKDYPLSCHSITGYSGGGKAMISSYLSADRQEELSSPAQYALENNHKHLREMQYITKLDKAPLFSPIVADYYSGMLVVVPLYTHLLNDRKTPEGLTNFYSDYYKGESIIKITHKDDYSNDNGFLYSNVLSGTDSLQIIVTGNSDRINLMARFCNLGKGASGAAVQCMNLMMGVDETTGLELYSEGD